MASAQRVLAALRARTFSRVHSRSLVSTSSAHSTRPFVPPASLQDIVETDDELDPLSHPAFSPESARQRPPTPTFYTTRSDYYDVLAGLQDALHTARATLKSLHLHPLPRFALDALPPAHPAWADRADMGVTLNTPLSAGMYRHLIAALRELELYHRIAKSAGVDALEESLGDLISSFESTKQVEARVRRQARQADAGKRAVLDAFGRSYTVGRRKTSTARVWMIKTHATTNTKDTEAENDKDTSLATLLAQPAIKVPPPPTTSVLINAVPITSYFPLPADREAVLRPLKLTGLLGAYNIFALVRGGGTSGQSGSLALAVSKACAAHAPEVEPILRKANLMKRDPRMVERKKTGLAKARKAYTWVKR